MTPKIYNTLTGRKEEFQPLSPPRVKMYVCGITPYDETHLGHARAYLTFDIIRRYLEYKGYEVFYVQNITDIDDKIIQKSQSLNSKSETNARPEIQDPKQKCQAVADKYTASYFEVMDKLNVKRANIYPKATEHILDMVEWIKVLIDKGYAYVVDGDVYFEVEKFPDYGKLSKRKKKDMLAGLPRVEADPRKRSPLDFALWKKAKEGEPFWETPWGKGRPGWHIECSVMSTKYLGEQFDLHGGGMDLEFPHHENEIAQSEAFTGKVPWVKYWVHNGFVTVNKQKMSKSLGNFFTLKEIYEKFDPMVVRLFLLSTHYRSPINYSDQELMVAKEAYLRIVKFVQEVDFLLGKSAEHAPAIEREDLEEEIMEFKKKFEAAMDDDFNSAAALAVIFELIRYYYKKLEEGEVEKECLEEMKDSVLELCGVLGLEVKPLGKAKEHSEEIENLIREREEARKKKDFKRADEIRNQLKEMGIELEDTPYGTRWKYRT